MWYQEWYPDTTNSWHWGNFRMRRRYVLQGQTYSRFNTAFGIASGGSNGGGPGPPKDQCFLNFIPIFAKIWQICMFAPLPGGLASPPTGNHGSALIAVKNCMLAFTTGGLRSSENEESAPTQNYHISRKPKCQNVILKLTNWINLAELSYFNE